MTTAPEDQLARAASLLREDLTTRAAYVSDASIYRRLPAAVAHATECDPQALLPTIPPTVQRACVEGSGPLVSPCSAAAARRSSQITPGSISAVSACG